MAKQNLTRQLFDYVLSQYDTKPKYLWKNYPDYGVLRHVDNRKWYAIVMNVEKSSLELSDAGSVDRKSVV